MTNRTEILNELKALSPVLVGLQQVNVYTVPNGYFDLLSDDILATLNIEKNSFSANNKVLVNDVPAGYFDNLADNILAKIKQQQVDNVGEELRNLSPMLYSIQNENVYSTPTGYFENLSNELVNKVEPQAAKVVTMRKSNFTFIKYAVAAVFTGIIAFGPFKYTASGNKLDAVTQQGLAIAKENKFDEELAKVTDDDIVKYLETNAADADAALLANVVDETELPTQEDYLTDEKALDNFLNNINLDDLKN
ncbi:MAG: hypothetical protein IPP48_04765 [Chitinophagaceae bacterium]|nr:hypothetical protein [Chitinophagaceae bacterium]